MLDLRKIPVVLASITLYAKFVQTQQLRSCTSVKVSFDKMNAFCCLLLSCECFICGGEEQIFFLSDPTLVLELAFTVPQNRGENVSPLPLRTSE